MKFKLSKKALDFARKKNINSLFIDPDLNSKESCCTIGTVDFNISHKDTGDRDRYLKYDDKADNVEIFYNPNIDFFIDEDEEIEISVFGIGNFKKFYIVNEINSIESN